MGLTPAELALIEIIRDPALPNYAVSIASTDGRVAVTMAFPGEGVSVGAGRNFEAAFFRVCGRESPAGRFYGEPDTSQH